MQKFSKQQVKSVGLKKETKIIFTIFSLSKSKENWLDKTKLFFCSEVRILKKKQQQTRTSNSRILRSKKTTTKNLHIKI